MKITPLAVTVRDIVEGYIDKGEEGVYGYGGKLDIRPPYQREFVYKGKQQEAVMHTINKNLPLNVIYWVKTGEDTYEVLDGQQRIISFCQYIEGIFAVDFQYFHNFTDEKDRAKILDYELLVYVCEGTDKEKLDWFRTINIAGEKLTDQELRNAVYSGAWVTDAKAHFSKGTNPAHQLAEEYMSGRPIRQDYLATALKWISHREEVEIEEYMAKNAANDNAEPLWIYFQEVIDWVKRLFPKYRAEMKGVDWGILYNTYKDKQYSPGDLEIEVSRLMADEEVKNKKGVYTYVFDRNEKHLNLRSFTDAEKTTMYERQGGVCNSCKEEFKIKEMHGDHILPWSKGGKTILENGQMLCRTCNLAKLDK